MMQLSRNGCHQIIDPTHSHMSLHADWASTPQTGINYNEPENYDLIIIVTTNVRKVFDLPPDPPIPLTST